MSDSKPFPPADPPAVSPPGRAPATVQTIAALAWLLAAFCFLVAAERLNSWSDVTFFAVLGAWSAYLGMALTRGVRYAWSACRLIAVGTVGFNLLFSSCMTTLLVADAAGLRDPPFNVPLQRTLAFVGFALVMTLGPLAIYKALGQGVVKRWCGLEDEDGLPIRPSCA